jgi:hypothetical protein
MLCMAPSSPQYASRRYQWAWQRKSTGNNRMEASSLCVGVGVAMAMAMVVAMVVGGVRVLRSAAHDAAPLLLRR